MSSHLAQFPIYLVHDNLNRREFENTYDRHPLFSRIVIDAQDLSRVYSFLIDYNQVYLRSCRARLTKGFTTFRFDDFSTFTIERGHFRLGLKLNSFSAISFRQDNLSRQYYVMNTSDRAHQTLKQLLERIYSRHTSIPDDNQPRPNTKVFWDYDNVPLSSDIPFEQDGIAQQIKDYIYKFRPIAELLCMSAKPMKNQEVEKVKMILKSSEINRELEGKDSVDERLAQEIEKRTKDLPNAVIIISGDHYYQSLVESLIEKKINVLIISDPKTTNQDWLKLLDSDQIFSLNYDEKVLHDKSRIQPCNNCLKVISGDLTKHLQFHDPNICHICGKTRTGLYDHTRTKHPNYICKQCELIYETEQDCINHTKVEHNPRYCNSCEREFSTEMGLQQHLKNSKKHK